MLEVYRSFILDCEPTESHLQSCLDVARDHGAEPDLVIVASSGEFLTFSTAAGNLLLLRIRNALKDIPLTIVALGCLGFHACILEINRRESKCALIILFEYPTELNQLNLNSLGVGKEGLRARGGAALLLVGKQGLTTRPEKRMLIGQAVIFGSRPGLFGMLGLAEQLANYLRRVPHGPGCAVMSFELPISFSRRLVALLNRLLEAKLRPVNWLESSELDGIHRLTIKPVLEMQEHIHGKFAAATILSLGGGGRVGCVQVGCTEQIRSLPGMPRTRSIELSFEKQMESSARAVKNIPGNRRVDSEFKNNFLYMKHTCGDYTNLYWQSVVKVSDSIDEFCVDWKFNNKL